MSIRSKFRKTSSSQGLTKTEGSATTKVSTKVSSKVKSLVKKFEKIGKEGNDSSKEKKKEQPTSTVAKGQNGSPKATNEVKNVSKFGKKGKEPLKDTKEESRGFNIIKIGNKHSNNEKAELPASDIENEGKESSHYLKEELSASKTVPLVDGPAPEIKVEKFSAKLKLKAHLKLEKKSDASKNDVINDENRGASTNTTTQPLDEASGVQTVSGTWKPLPVINVKKRIAFYSDAFPESDNDLSKKDTPKENIFKRAARLKTTYGPLKHSGKITPVKKSNAFSGVKNLVAAFNQRSSNANNNIPPAVSIEPDDSNQTYLKNTVNTHQYRGVVYKQNSQQQKGPVSSVTKWIRNPTLIGNKHTLHHRHSLESTSTGSSEASSRVVIFTDAIRNALRGKRNSTGKSSSNSSTLDHVRNTSSSITEECKLPVLHGIGAQSSGIESAVLSVSKRHNMQGKTSESVNVNTVAGAGGTWYSWSPVDFRAQNCNVGSTILDSERSLPVSPMTIRLLTEQDSEFYDSSSFERSGSSDKENEKVDDDAESLLYIPRTVTKVTTYPPVILSTFTPGSVPSGKTPEIISEPKTYPTTDALEPGNVRLPSANLADHMPYSNGQSSTASLDRELYEGEMPLGKLITTLMGPQGLAELDADEVNTMVKLPVVGRPPVKLWAPKPRSVNNISRMQKLICDWGGSMEDVAPGGALEHLLFLDRLEQAGWA